MSGMVPKPGPDGTADQWEAYYYDQCKLDPPMMERWAIFNKAVDALPSDMVFVKYRRPLPRWCNKLNRLWLRNYMPTPSGKGYYRQGQLPT